MSNAIDIGPYGAYNTDRARAFELAAQRGTFQAYPAAEQQRVLAHVRKLLVAEAARGQKAHSALWRNAKAVYGIDPETVNQEA